MSKLRAGDLRWRVDIIRRTETPDINGILTVTDTVLYANVPCKVESIKGLERNFGAINTSFLNKSFRMYFHSGITQKDFIRYNGDLYDIYETSQEDFSPPDQTLLGRARDVTK